MSQPSEPKPLLTILGRPSYSIEKDYAEILCTARTILAEVERLRTECLQAASTYHAQAEHDRSQGKDSLQNTVYCGAYQNFAESLEPLRKLVEGMK